MTHKLDIYEGRLTCHVAWAYEDDEGAWVGQEVEKTIDQLKAEKADAYKDRNDEGRDKFEYTSVEIAAKEWAEQNPKGLIQSHGGFEFENVTTAKRFLAAMRATLKAARSEYDTGAPWPEWAKQAHAAGWKPPKGWKP